MANTIKMTTNDDNNLDLLNSIIIVVMMMVVDGSERPPFPFGFTSSNAENTKKFPEGSGSSIICTDAVDLV